MSKWFSWEENEYYEVFAEELRRRQSEKVIFLSGTPVLLLEDELFTPARKDYYNSIIRGVSNNLFAGHYMFKPKSTCAAISCLYKDNNIKYKNQINYVENIKDILDINNFSLASLGLNYPNSCLLADKIGAIHFKVDGSSESKLVKFIEGPELDIFRNYYLKEVVPSSNIVRSNGIKNLLYAAKLSSMNNEIAQAAMDVLKKNGYIDPVTTQEAFCYDEVRFEIIENGSVRTFSVKSYIELESRKREYNLYLDEKRAIIYAMGKKVLMRQNTKAYFMLKTLVQLPGREIKYKDLYKMHWDSHKKESPIPMLVLKNFDYLDSKTYGVLRGYVRTAGDKFVVSPDFKTCIIQAANPPW